MDKLKVTIEGFIKHVMGDIDDIHIVVGPVRRQPSNYGKNWYVIVATAGPDKQFRCDQLITVKANADRMRTLILAALVQRQPIIIHDMDCEVKMARLCEALWPGERVSELRATVEAEYLMPKKPKEDE